MLSPVNYFSKTPQVGGLRQLTRRLPVRALAHSNPYANSCIVPASPCTTQRKLLCGDELPASLAEELGNFEEDVVDSPEMVFQVHASAVTALAWVNDSTLISAGMDKTVCFVNIEDMSVAKRIILSGGPAHSILPSSSGIVMGLHSKSLLELVSPPSSVFLQDMQYSVLESNLCGWPRDLASNGTSLFSSSCNEIRQFDTATKKSKIYRLDKGDILSLACTKDRLYAGTVDGSLFGFSIDAKTGTLELRDTRPKAHAGRVTDLQIHHGMLFSSSYDGTVKSWCLDGLEIVNMTSARNGARVLALAQEEGSYLYAAGSDGTIRVFDPLVLEELRVIAPPGLNQDESVRALAVRKDKLIAATSTGKLIRC